MMYPRAPGHTNASSPVRGAAGDSSQHRLDRLCQAEHVPGPDIVLWMPWALLLSAVAAALAVRAARRGHLLGALRWSGWALIPPALLLTGTLRLVGRITAAVLSWSASLAFNPVTWLGIALTGIAVSLIGTARVLEARRPAVGTPPRRDAVGGGGAQGSGSTKAGNPDDDLADIEDLLRRRGIS